MTAKTAPTEVAIHELIAGRWSPRAYSERAGDARAVASGTGGGALGAVVDNLQPWRFVTFDRNRDEVAFKQAFDTLVPFNQGWNANVPVLICRDGADAHPRAK